MSHVHLGGRLATLALTLSLLPATTFAQDPNRDILDPDLAPAASSFIELKYARFDPLQGEPLVDPALSAGPDTKLWIVQFEGRGDEARRRAIRAVGGQIVGVLHHNAHLVRTRASIAEQIGEQDGIRWVGAYHPAYRMEAEMLTQFRAGDVDTGSRYNVLLHDPAEKGIVLQRMANLPLDVVRENDRSMRMEVDMSLATAAQVARFDEVIWIDRWAPAEVDMDNVRVQGGANYVEQVGNYLGQGIVGEIYEGIDPTHPDFQGPGRVAPIVHRSGTVASHGHCTFGIVFGNGTGNAQAEGMMPLGQGVYANYSFVGVSRWTIISELKSLYDGVFQTASWGNGRVTTYTSISAELDQIIFDHDFPITQSQSNAGNRDSRPQAWAKNVISVGGVRHGNNPDPSDDNWTGGASIGPADDGRIKPDLVAYYDLTFTQDRPGAAGYNTNPDGNYTNFSGTSGATPIVAGHLGIAQQMFTDGIFGNELAVPGGTRFENRPHFTTAKALMINTARQYSFSGANDDLTRVHQGWGFPDLQRLYDMRDKMLLVDEDVVLAEGERASYKIDVGFDSEPLRVTMVFSDPPGNPASSVDRINNLNLKVVAPDGTTYWGNNGLLTSTVSTSGGTPNSVDTVENVFVTQPEPGPWTVEVIARDVNQDTHLETAAVDVDFALVVTGGFSECAGVASLTGTGCDDGFFLKVLEISMDGCPDLGTTITVDSDGIVPFGGSQFFVLGSDDENWGGLTLPFELDVLGAPGCFIYNNHDRIFPVPYNFSGGSIEVAIPTDNELVGQEFFFQTITLDANLSPRSSNQLVLTLGAN